MISDVLVFCPVLRLESATVQALIGLDWRGPLSVLLQKDNPTGDPWSDHLWQYQRGRDLFLRGDFDAVLVIESDIIPPADTLTRLAAQMAAGADLVYGVYLFRGGRVVNILERYPEPARNLGESLTVRGLYAAAVRRGVVPCSGAGLGCVLIRRQVIERIPFEAPDRPGFFDWQWTEQVYRAGFSMVADMGIQCGHVDPDAGELWPADLSLTL